MAGKKGSGKKKAKVRATGTKAKAAPVPTAAETAAFLGAKMTKALTPAQVKSLLKPLPGYTNVLDDAAAQYEEDGSILAVKGVSASALLDVKARQRDLSKREEIAKEVHRSLYEQRMQADDEGIGMLRGIGRRINALAEDHPELLTNWKSVLDFLAEFAPPGKKASTDDGSGGGGDVTTTVAKLSKK